MIILLNASPMPRAKSENRLSLIASAMECFWSHGFEATSLDDLVRATGVSRQGIYSDFGGKAALFEKCLLAYVDNVVTPAFTQVEHVGADLKSAALFFEQQISRGEMAGLPGPGCLMTNTMTDVAPHSTDVMRIVRAHNERLQRGFSAAIGNTAKLRGTVLMPTEQRALSLSLLVFANGLWTLSRTVGDAAVLRQATIQMFQLVEQKVTS